MFCVREHYLPEPGRENRAKIYSVASELAIPFGNRSRSRDSPVQPSFTTILRSCGAARAPNSPGPSPATRWRSCSKSPSPSGEGMGVGAVQMARRLTTCPTPTPPLKGRGFPALTRNRPSQNSSSAPVPSSMVPPSSPPRPAPASSTWPRTTARTTLRCASRSASSRSSRSRPTASIAPTGHGSAGRAVSSMPSSTRPTGRSARRCARLAACSRLRRITSIATRTRGAPRPR